MIGDDGDPSKIHLSCHAGEMMANTMKRVGAVGLVTNGGVRDIREVTALGGFGYFARGLVVAHGRPSIYGVGRQLVAPLSGWDNALTSIAEWYAEA